MPVLIEKPVKDWSVELKCKGDRGCGYTYKYFENDVFKDGFKISGYHFDGTAVCEDRTYVYCGNCRRTMLVSTPARVFNAAPSGE